MCISYVWCLLLLLLYSSQNVEGAYHSQFSFDVPVSLNMEKTQSATFITEITAMTVYDSPSGDDKETITDITFFFNAVHSNGRVFDVPKRQMHKSYKKPLLMIHTPRHLHESQYITPLRPNFHSIPIQDPYFVYSLDTMPTVPNPFDLGAPITGTDNNKNQSLVALMRTTQSSHNGDYEILDPLNPHFGVKDILDAEANLDAKRRNNNINRPKFIVPFDTDKDKRVRYSIFIHQKLALIKPQNIDLETTVFVRFYFNVLDGTVNYRDVHWSDFGLSDQGEFQIFIFSRNIFETKVVSPVNVRGEDEQIDKENFYLCRGAFHAGQHLPDIICEFIQDPDTTGHFQNSISQLTVEDLDAVVYMDNNDVDTVTLAGMRMNFDQIIGDTFEPIAISSYYKTLNDFIAIVGSINEVPCDNRDTKSVKNVIRQFETKPTIDVSLSTISMLENFFLGLKIIPNTELYDHVKAMIWWLEEVRQQYHTDIRPDQHGVVDFTVTNGMVYVMKHNLKHMKMFLFTD